MARKCLIAREEKRRKLIAKYAEKRRELKEAGDYEALQKLPRDSSPVRLRNRCALTGRPRAYYRKFGLCRVQLRQLALECKIHGIRKSSW